jgi:hypothetical protein
MRKFRVKLTKDGKVVFTEPTTEIVDAVGMMKRWLESGEFCHATIQASTEMEGWWEAVDQDWALRSYNAAQALEVYTDEQFATDIEKVSERLDQMGAEAIEEDAQGKTLEFP